LETLVKANEQETVVCFEVLVRTIKRGKKHSGNNIIIMTIIII